jgi:ATP-binding cassette subfamily C protein
VLLLAAGPWLVRRGLTVGEVLGGLTYVLAGLQPALRTLIGGVGGAGLRFVITLGRILDAGGAPLTEPPAEPPAEPPGGNPPGANGRGADGTLTLRGVTFAYGPHAEPVLRELDLTVADGEHLAIVGPSGIGKSTLANLLCGLLAPDAGTVEIGGLPVTGRTADLLSSVRVLIPQEAYVFAGTVRENLAYLRPAASEGDLLAAVAAVGADELVARLGGPDATLDPARLSAGERQLIALARAYLSPARLAVLDEATCHLDPAAERRAEEAFAARPGTLIVIAHRISSAVRAERVLVLDGTGAVAGDHRSVLAASPLYRDLMHAWQPTPTPTPTHS